MRHGASVVAAMEGISRPAFRIAHELTQNSRSGLTVRFLSKKLELPEEEVEYLVDLNHRFLFTDLTKIRIVNEGLNAVRRIADGLENRGDVHSLSLRIKGLGPHEFRLLEERIGIDKPGTKKSAAEELLQRYYAHPDSIVEYVATRDFSPLAQELFDIVWQSKTGILPVGKIRAIHGGTDYDVEEGLWELFRGCALFEMFRFDPEERLVRVAGILSEIRQWRESSSGAKARKAVLRAYRGTPDRIVSHGLNFSDTVCRVVAAIAAKPARLRGDGDLFKEDMRRLTELCPEVDEPPLSTYVWVAEGVGWLARVDTELRAAELECLLNLNPVERHRLLFEWLTTSGNEQGARRTLTRLLDGIKAGVWYPLVEFVDYAMQANAKQGQPVLKQSGGHWRYVAPASAQYSEKGLARSLEEAMPWMGVVDYGEAGTTGLFRLTELGVALLTGQENARLTETYRPKSSELIVQPNFDIVVPTQDTDPLLTVPLDQFAVRGSTGQATVYTLTKDSFTEAIQDGHDGDAFVEFLLAHNRGGDLPANVMTTLEDWRGGIKRVHLKTLHVLESADPLVVADLLHRRKYRKCLGALDPRKVIVYTGIARADLIRDLEKDGFIVE
jgi:hypothetical protein